MKNPYKLVIKPFWAFLIILFAAQLTVAAEARVDDSAVFSGEKRVLQRFGPLFDRVTLEMANNQKHFLNDPVAYDLFVSRVLEPLWDSRSTTSALIGRARFDRLDDVEQAALVKAVDNTLRRYAFEGLARYSGQLFRVVDVVVNKPATMGWVQVLMESSLIPDLHFDVLIKRVNAGDWKAVDVRFKGITYVAVKKHKFRKIIEEKGVQALIGDLQIKNREYFTGICAKANIEGRPPCLTQVASRVE